MKTLHILYDGCCELCRRCRAWLSAQPTYVALEFLPLQWSEVHRRFPGIDSLSPERQLIVVNESGEVWTGVDAWIMCLWASRKFRPWSIRLSHPALKPMARRAFDLLSSNRKGISRILFGRAPEGAAKALEEMAPADTACPETRGCRTQSAVSPDVTAPAPRN